MKKVKYISVFILLVSSLLLFISVNLPKTHNKVENPTLIHQSVDFLDKEKLLDKKLSVGGLLNVLVKEMNVGMKIDSISVEDNIVYVNINKNSFPFKKIKSGVNPKYDFNDERKLQAYALSSIYQTIYENFGYETRFTCSGKDAQLLIGRIGREYVFTPAEYFEGNQQKLGVHYYVYSDESNYERILEDNVYNLPLDEYLVRLSDYIGEDVLINDITIKGNNIYIDFNSNSAPFKYNEYYSNSKLDSETLKWQRIREFKTLNSMAKSYLEEYNLDNMYISMNGAELHLSDNVVSKEFPWKVK